MKILQPLKKSLKMHCKQNKIKQYFYMGFQGLAKKPVSNMLYKMNNYQLNILKMRIISLLKLMR